MRHLGDGDGGWCGEAASNANVKSTICSRRGSDEGVQFHQGCERCIVSGTAVRIESRTNKHRCAAAADDDDHNDDDDLNVFVHAAGVEHSVGRQLTGPFDRQIDAAPCPRANSHCAVRLKCDDRSVCLHPTDGACYANRKVDSGSRGNTRRRARTKGSGRKVTHRSHHVI